MRFPARRFGLAAALCLMLPAAHAQLTDLLRSVTTAVKNAAPAAPPPQTGTTAVVGIRGMDEETALAQAGSGGSSQDVLLLDGWAATPAEAARLAGGKGLQKRQVALKTLPIKPAEDAPETSR